jgi:hypothetical protein
MGLTRTTAGFVAVLVVALAGCGQERPVGDASHPQRVYRSWTEIEESHPTVQPRLWEAFQGRRGGFWLDRERTPTVRHIGVVGIREGDQEILNQIARDVAHRYLLTEVRYTLGELTGFGCLAERILNERGFESGWSIRVDRNHVRVFIWGSPAGARDALLREGIPQDAFVVASDGQVKVSSIVVDRCGRATVGDVQDLGRG